MKSPLEIRSFEAFEMERILEIENASFGAEAYDRKLFAKYYRSPGVLFLVAEEGGEIWGYLLASVRGRKAELVSVAVHPAARGKGIASALLRRALRKFPAGGLDRFNLMVRLDNLAAQSLYAKFGFTRIRRVREYYEDGSDGLLMTRQLGENQAGSSHVKGGRK
jgi:[ribosomal protein S18]-alanine N-acetyltransferase